MLVRIGLLDCGKALDLRPEEEWLLRGASAGGYAESICDMSIYGVLFHGLKDQRSVRLEADKRVSLVQSLSNFYISGSSAAFCSSGK